MNIEEVVCFGELPSNRVAEKLLQVEAAPAPGGTAESETGMISALMDFTF